MLEVYEFDEAKAAQVKVVNKDPLDFLDHRLLQQFRRERRGVAIFVPTRKGVAQAAVSLEEAEAERLAVFLQRPRARSVRLLEHLRGR